MRRTFSPAILPASYYAIYRDPFLSRYAPGGGLLWGHRHPFRGRFHGDFGGPQFPGTEPLGDYPIHIIVKNGRTALMGAVGQRERQGRRRQPTDRRPHPYRRSKS
jgi:hypothetical protein